MKKLLFVFASVALVSMLSCTFEQRKVTGVVQEFVPTGINGQPVIKFTDMRKFTLDEMPAVQIENGSEIAIYYKMRTGDCVTPDSIVMLKAAPKKSAVQLKVVNNNTEYVIPLKDGVFEAMCSFIEKKGRTVFSCAKEFVYLDKNSNTHTMVTMHRTNLKDDILQITVWVSGRTIKKDKKFWYYIITNNAITIGGDSDKEVIKSAVADFLEIIK